MVTIGGAGAWGEADKGVGCAEDGCEINGMAQQRAYGAGGAFTLGKADFQGIGCAIVIDPAGPYGAIVHAVDIACPGREIGL